MMLRRLGLTLPRPPRRLDERTKRSEINGIAYYVFNGVYFTRRTSTACKRCIWWFLRPTDLCECPYALIAIQTTARSVIMDCSANLSPEKRLAPRERDPCSFAPGGVDQKDVSDVDRTTGPASHLYVRRGVDADRRPGRREHLPHVDGYLPGDRHPGRQRGLAVSAACPPTRSRRGSSSSTNGSSRPRSTKSSTSRASRSTAWA